MTHFINPKITIRQRNFIIGTILGGSSIVKPSKGKNCYLSMRSKDFEWLKFKALELQNLASYEPITIEKTNRWHSICYPLFNEFHQMFYDETNERKLTAEVLDLLQDVAMAIWFVDCGKYEDGQITLNTHIWGEQGSNEIVEYFSRLECQAEVFRERNNYRLRLDKDSSIDFLKIIVPHLPKFVLDKLDAIDEAS